MTEDDEKLMNAVNTCADIMIAACGDEKPRLMVLVDMMAARFIHHLYGHDNEEFLKAVMIHCEHVVRYADAWEPESDAKH